MIIRTINISLADCLMLEIDGPTWQGVITFLFLFHATGETDKSIINRAIFLKSSRCYDPSSRFDEETNLQ